ncbi:MAG TPA: cation:proton antiporter [Gemmatimonadales bacterium]|nr:cation:proton antiporter [Gemmatimonadales bacterium]
MRWVASLAVLGLMMALFVRLTAGGPLEARATLALGFLLLAAHIGGQLAQRAHLPRITGYLVIGFLVGPSWLGLVGREEVGELRFIGDAAVALIAFAAGAELKWAALRREGRALARVSLGAIAFPIVTIALVLLAVSPWFPLTSGLGIGDRVVLALVLGTVAAAFSPAVTMAVIEEADAHGPFARAVLGVTIVGDVVLIVLLTVILAVGRPLVSAGAIHLGTVWSALLHVPLSAVAGVALGVLVDRYLRLVKRDTPLFLVALAFFTAEVARLLGLEGMLMALAAGFYLENVSPVEGERLVEALRRGSLPVYVVFFGLAGAGLHLEALRELWPWILVIVGLRAWALRTGVRWAGRDPAVTPALARHAWLGLISQAGLALGLATVTRRAFPAWGVSLEALIVTMIGIHELVGPVLFRRALGLAGEIKEGRHAPESVAVEPGAVSAPGGGGGGGGV